MRVIGTAGHVDHGKSTLVAALTGTHPDRLKEEQAREMTIELGFAWMTLPDGEEVGIVDVPGHRDFIENMLAGVGGIDAALFVVAADEGVMPQTREHLSILDILQIQGGVIAITKVDMIDDPDWVDLVEMDVRDAVKGTILQDAPIVRVSARERIGLEDLKQALSACLAEREPRPDLGRPRLPIDRVFTMSGFGTIVTGTLVDGQLSIGGEIEVLPSGLRGRVRGLQSHKQKETLAMPGSRTAVNISGIDFDQIERGQILAYPDKYRTTSLVDLRFRLLPDISAPIRHNTQVKFFIGTSEVVARLRLLGVEELLPGQEGWIQLELRLPVIAVRGDRYILRRPSPSETLGGGVVVDPQPDRRHKRFAKEVIARLESLQHGTPAEILLQACLALGAVTIRDAAARARLSADQVEQAVQELLASRQIIFLDQNRQSQQDDALIIAFSTWSTLSRSAFEQVSKYHLSHPLRKGIPKEELKSRLKMLPRIFNLAIRLWVAENKLVEYGTLISLPEHQVQFTQQQNNLIRDLLNNFARSPYSPPSVKDCISSVGEDVYFALVDSGDLIQVSPDVVFVKKDYEVMQTAVKEIILNEGSIAVVQFRDRFQTSRKYALGFLEHLDSIGFTLRDGDVRRLRKSA